MSDPYLGEIRMVGFNFAPNGWAFCQGQLLSIQQNAALFSLLGTTYGGDGRSTFQLPDLRGRTPVGFGQGLGLSNISIGEQGGTENATLTTQNMPAHTHTAAVTGGGAVTGQIAIPAATSTTGEGAVPSTSTVLGPIAAGGRPGELYSTAAPSTTLAPFNVNLQGTAPTIQNSVTGNSIPFSLRNPYMGINFIIALQGIFPSRG
ncbi:phage tail protein [Paraburkholderia pallida]|uniref:Phage tail protein n=1 Tax=Paraburkholderia pallida TaxID=2547399 RepID=A0A4P7D8I3_9BURK|nr:tail fiber protein [Paraburkholderia pallida]QBR02982.1 phage tail protein [Paraburkholderia pallida]